jgi:peptidoglycan/xylan/chitin deacetylase (PgdA/CDA1 family)
LDALALNQNSNKIETADKTTISSNNKIVILTFGDTIKSQITTAKPILDLYGFKASFFITCGFPSENGENKNESKNSNDNHSAYPRMSWNDILALQEDGQDIQSKGMTHRDLNLLTPNDLNFEIGGSKGGIL